MRERITGKVCDKKKGYKKSKNKIKAYMSKFDTGRNKE